MIAREHQQRRWEVRSPAKVNWTLRVLGRRADGYHELESLVSPVSLFDKLTFSSREEPGVELSCDHPGVPAGGRNLIVQAAELLAAEAGVGVGLSCRLEKRIPIGGGLGGGSSNAAAALLALNHLWELDWPLERLAPLAARLGSDVPLFLHRGPVIMRGRGERVEPARLGWNGWLVLMFPGVPAATAEVYKAWRPGTSPDPALDRFAEKPGSAAEWMGWTFNMLEDPAREVCPLLGPLMERTERIAGRPVRLSGSGSTLFTAFDSEHQAAAFAAAAERDASLETCVVRPIERFADAFGEDIHGDQ